MARQLDAKMRVLTAIYAEYQKDVPDMMNIHCNALRMDWEAFRAAVMKLQNEGLIQGLITKPPEETKVGAVEEIDMSSVMPTMNGLKAVERFVETGLTDTPEERLERLKRAAEEVCENEIGRFVEDVIKDVKKKMYIRNMRGMK